jgi:hypothetical protein
LWTNDVVCVPAPEPDAVRFLVTRPTDDDAPEPEPDAVLEKTINVWLYVVDEDE